MPDLRFADAALDPRIIPAIYNGCDQWCDYCPATDRCLAFRCRPAGGSSVDIYRDISDAMQETMQLLHAARPLGGSAPVALGRPDHGEACAPTPGTLDDPLERMGRRYVMLAAAYLVTRDDVEVQIPKRPDGPTPLDVVVRYHMLIAAKVYRALLSASADARTGAEAGLAEANLSAKVALLCADRSDEALSVVALDDPDPRVGHLRDHLRRLCRDLEARFPGARGTARPGFDAPA